MTHTPTAARLARAERDWEMAQLYAQGTNQQVIAEKFGVHPNTVRRACQSTGIKRPPSYKIYNGGSNPPRYLSFRQAFSSLQLGMLGVLQKRWGCETAAEVVVEIVRDFLEEQIKKQAEQQAERRQTNEPRVPRVAKGDTAGGARRAARSRAR